MTDCWFNGVLNIRRGEIVKITRVIPGGGTLRVTVMENITTGETRTSRDNGTLMTVTPVTLGEPITGRVSSVIVGSNDVTNFVIEEGVLIDQMFVRAGEIQKAQQALVEIFVHGLDSYVKIVDPYVSPDTIESFKAYLRR